MSSLLFSLFVNANSLHIYIPTANLQQKIHIIKKYFLKKNLFLFSTYIYLIVLTLQQPYIKLNIDTDILKRTMELDYKTLTKYIDNSLSTEETQKVEEWYNKSEEHKQKMQDFYTVYKLEKASYAYEKADENVSFERIKSKITLHKDNTSPLSPTRFIPIFRKIATPLAAFFTGIVLTASILLFLMRDNINATYIASTDDNQRSEITLPDGTKVWLNATTQVKYTESFWNKKRILALDGEAYLEVKPNKKKPFIVSAQDVDVKVLGTKFNVRSRESEAEVITTLLEGSVQVKSSKVEDSTILKPGQSIIINAKDGSSELFTYSKPHNILLWRTGELTFDKSTLQEIAQTLEQHFNIHFQFENDKLKEEIYTCSFSTNDNIDYILNILTLTEKFKYRVIDNKVILY